MVATAEPASARGMTPIAPSDLFESPNALAPHYQRFRVDGRPGEAHQRLLLTGHSHQAWPDRSLEGQIRAWTDAAEHADRKWDQAAAAAAKVQRGYARWLGLDPDSASRQIALGANTHELVVRFLSALDLRSRPRLVTTDGEFHTIRRQLERLEEEGLEVVRLSATGPETLSTRLAAAVDDRTAAVLVSSVLFQSARSSRGWGKRCAPPGDTAPSSWSTPITSSTPSPTPWKRKG